MMHYFQRCLFMQERLFKNFFRKYFESKNALFCRNFYQIALLFLKNPACKIAIFISQNLFHKNLNNL